MAKRVPKRAKSNLPPIGLSKRGSPTYSLDQLYRKQRVATGTGTGKRRKATGYLTGGGF